MDARHTVGRTNESGARFLLQPMSLRVPAGGDVVDQLLDLHRTRSTMANLPPRRFRSFPTDSFDSLSMHFPEGVSRRGVYVLTFEDESRYVGQSVDVVTRCSAHRRRWDDTVSIAFTEVTSTESLDTVEREVLATVARDHPVRNIALVANVTYPSPSVNTVIEPAQLIDWFATSHQHDAAPRLDDVDQRLKTVVKFKELSALQEFDAIADGVRAYVQACVPAPRTTERHLWALTSLPSTGKTRRLRRLSALSVGPVETLVVLEITDENDRMVGGFLNLAPPRGKDKVLLAASVARHRFAHEDTDVYANAGLVTQLWFDDMAMLEQMMRSKVIVRLARNLTVSLMFKGRTSYGHYHDFNLADHMV
ncbi:GIY-YIG nuclease family protein [Speluncibacter jeojiensis]|uniref:GIY-YIG nuclease family protein n=1 Tax=Speluncibacter jeojiensis TaxID=2710754 RepID=A0A9X4M7R5_9ACTN|nr:GIY-YIG nuclease family protein [Corynebacteriales bacterium D3-21]